MGRAKLENVLLSDKSSRKDCFNKRCKGALKKMYELAHICGSGVHVIVEGEDGNIYEFHRRMSRALVPTVIENDEAATVSNGEDDNQETVTGCTGYNAPAVVASGCACGCSAAGGTAWGSSYNSANVPSGCADAPTSMLCGTANGTGADCSTAPGLPNVCHSRGYNITGTYAKSRRGGITYGNGFSDLGNVGAIRRSAGRGRGVETGRALALPPPSRPTSNPKPTNRYMFYNGRTIMDTGRPVTQELRQNLLFLCNCFDCSKGYSDRLFETIATDQSLPPLHSDSRTFSQKAPFMGTDYLHTHEKNIPIGPLTDEQHNQRQHHQDVSAVVQLENLENQDVKYVIASAYGDLDGKVPIPAYEDPDVKVAMPAYAFEASPTGHEALGYTVQPSPSNYLNLSASTALMTEDTVPGTMLHPRICDDDSIREVLQGTIIHAEVCDGGANTETASPEQFKPVVDFPNHDNDNADGNYDLPSASEFYGCESDGNYLDDITYYNGDWNATTECGATTETPINVGIDANEVLENDPSSVQDFECMMFGASSSVSHEDDALRYTDNEFMMFGASSSASHEDDGPRYMDNVGTAFEKGKDAQYSYFHNDLSSNA